MIPANEIDRADCPFCGRTVKLRNDVLMWHHRAGLHYQLAGHDTSCEGSLLSIDDIAQIGAVQERRAAQPPPLLTMKRMARPTIVPELPVEPVAEEETKPPRPVTNRGGYDPGGDVGQLPRTQVSCVGCANAVISPTSGVYCRVFSEIINDLLFAAECPGWVES